MSPEVLLFVDGAWREGSGGTFAPILNPATAQTIGRHAMAETADLDDALEAAVRGFRHWSRMPAFERYRLLRKAAEFLRSDAERVSRVLTLEQGKPLAEARMEVNSASEILDWMAEEGRRLYGRLIPARASGVQQLVIKEPVGPVAAFSPWNFPIGQAVRKIGAALAAGCSIILKGPEETPASCAALVEMLDRAGVPAGVVNLVFGTPAEISCHLIESAAIRKISFTGSTAVGKQLAALGGRHMKRMTMELGGHAPVLVLADADIRAAVHTLVSSKFRNAGQVCASPTRFLVQEKVYPEFCAAFCDAARTIKVGDGVREGTIMGPLAHARRLEAMQSLCEDARRHGAEVEFSGAVPEGGGYFFPPTVLTEVPAAARLMNDEPFGPIVPINPFATLEEAIAEANRLAYGLAAYVWTRSADAVRQVTQGIEAGMVSINHAGLALAETPFGGIKDSGYGSEGGSEALEAYLTPKFVTQVIN